METIWKVLSCFVALLFLQLCNGLPLDLDHSYADGHTQFLTGLIAVLLTICGVICLAGCLCCQRRNGFKEFRDSPVVVSVASNLDHGHVNPIANGAEFTIFTPLSPPHQNNNVFQANHQYVARAEDNKIDDIDVTSWFGENERDFPRTKLKYIRELKKGWFGRVVEGTAQGLDGDDATRTPVVVRILEATASTRQRVLFLHDADVYRCPSHSNLLKLLGRSLESVPLLLLQEYCTQGDLKLYLRNQQPTKEKFLSGDYPLLWCYEITSAIKHLHSCNIAHPDLAVRNCLLTEDMHLKLGDYGCSTLDYPEDYYHGTENIPVRWCGPECITYTPTTIQASKVTTSSNVWSLGVCLWEIYDCGSQPYGKLSDDEVISQVLGPPSVRLARPSFTALYTDYIYRLMQLCWSSYESRPTVSQIEFMLSDLLQVHENTKQSANSTISVEDFDTRWDNFKPNAIVKTDNYQQLIEPESDLTNITVLNMNMNDTNKLSASLHNLAGSLDNLSTKEEGMDSWLDNVGDDLSFVKGLSAAMHDLDDAIALSSLESDAKPTKLEFKLGDYVNRTSSGSETEDENWKKKIERGAYTEKVRQKSRSVADLMILTHIDCSESDSETPLPSLDYKNLKYPKHNLENVSMAFTSEGNLLNVQDTFQEELKKLQEERRDSLLFVPETESQPNLPSKRILEDLNSTVLEPQNQVFNVYNVVTISPKYNLNRLINYNDDELSKLPDVVLNTMEKREIPKLSEIIENNIELMDYIIAKYETDEDVDNVIRIEEDPCTIKSGLATNEDFDTCRSLGRSFDINSGDAKNGAAKDFQSSNCDSQTNLVDEQNEDLVECINTSILQRITSKGIDINEGIVVTPIIEENICDNLKKKIEEQSRMDDIKIEDTQLSEAFIPTPQSCKVKKVEDSLKMDIVKFLNEESINSGDSMYKNSNGVNEEIILVKKDEININLESKKEGTMIETNQNEENLKNTEPTMSTDIEEKIVQIEDTLKKTEVVSSELIEADINIMSDRSPIIEEVLSRKETSSKIVSPKLDAVLKFTEVSPKIEKKSNLTNGLKIEENFEEDYLKIEEILGLTKDNLTIKVLSLKEASSNIDEQLNFIDSKIVPVSLKIEEVNTKIEEVLKVKEDSPKVQETLSHTEFNSKIEEVSPKIEEVLTLKKDCQQIEEVSPKTEEVLSIQETAPKIKTILKINEDFNLEKASAKVEETLNLTEEILTNKVFPKIEEVFDIKADSQKEILRIIEDRPQAEEDLIIKEDSLAEVLSLSEETMLGREEEESQTIKEKVEEISQNLVELASSKNNKICIEDFLLAERSQQIAEAPIKIVNVENEILPAMEIEDTLNIEETFKQNKEIIALNVEKTTPKHEELAKQIEETITPNIVIEEQLALSLTKLPQIEVEVGKSIETEEALPTIKEAVTIPTLPEEALPTVEIILSIDSKIEETAPTMTSEELLSTTEEVVNKDFQSKSSNYLKIEEMIPKITISEVESIKEIDILEATHVTSSDDQIEDVKSTEEINSVPRIEAEPIKIEESKKFDEIEEMISDLEIKMEKQENLELKKVNEVEETDKTFQKIEELNHIIETTQTISESDQKKVEENLESNKLNQTEDSLNITETMKMISDSELKKVEENLESNQTRDLNIAETTEVITDSELKKVEDNLESNQTQNLNIEETTQIISEPNLNGVLRFAETSQIVCDEENLISELEETSPLNENINEVTQDQAKTINFTKMVSEDTIEEANKNQMVYETPIKKVIVKTQDFINNEIITYEDSNISNQVQFDISEEQDEISPNSLTHSVFTSTPFHKRSLQDNSLVLCSASDDYSIDYIKPNEEETDTPKAPTKADFKYSLETWDNFLGRSFDEQHEFDTFSGQSLLFLENQTPEEEKTDLKVSQVINETYIPDTNAKNEPNQTFEVKETNETFEVNKTVDVNDTFVKGDVDLNDINVEVEEPEVSQGYDNPGYWESETSGGWFLHPQTNSDELSGQMDSSQDDSYVGFSMDDEIMAAIRNELLTKLPQAQRASSEQVDDGEEYETTNKNEVFVRYNCYNTPLSPIPEESYSEFLNSGQSTPHCTINTDLCDSNSDWSEPGMEPNSLIDDDTHSPRMLESPHKGLQHRHTPSQDSCCSNDTLFNLEDLQQTENHLETDDKTATTTPTNNKTFEVSKEDETEEEETFVKVRDEHLTLNKLVIKDEFLSVNEGLVTRSDTAVNVTNKDDEFVIKSEGDVCIRKKDNELVIVNKEEIKDEIEVKVSEASTFCFDVTQISPDDNVDSSLPTISDINTIIEAPKTEIIANFIITIDSSNCTKEAITDFIQKERQATFKPEQIRKEDSSSSSSETYLTVSDNLCCFALQNVAPLNSPEDRSWKHIEASLSKCPEIPEEPEDSIHVIYEFVEPVLEKTDSNEDRTLSSNSEEEYCYEIVEEMNLKNSLASIKTNYDDENIYDCIESKDKPTYVNETPCIKEASYVNELPTYVNDRPTYVNTDDKDVIEEYAKIPDYANAKNKDMLYENVNYAEYIDLVNEPVEVEYENNDNSRGSIEDVYGPLADIRFTGPTDSQMITTSFSESNELGDEQDWDSGSDTRSSSSGEFIWKEGEHEASVKALHAAPQDMMQETNEKESAAGEDESSSGSEEDGDGPEFVPSAWDMYATPTKSALRSPEKTLVKKGRGVSFKKQKYHCVYEYPREPETPVIHSMDMWKDPNYAIVDWDLDRDSEPFMPGPSDIDTLNDITTSTTPLHHSNRQHRNLYQITNVPDFIGSSILDEDFYISSSAKPFDMFGGPTSQFFPGKHCDWSELIKNNDNVTPDSGVEDITPGSLSDSSDYVKPSRQILPLKTLAQLAANKNANFKNTEIGGLRHTRNKLKLDLPPSPSAFTKSFSSSLEQIDDPIISRHVPTFTTFGKSRFVVQQVDTLSDDQIDSKNVSFEALPYKPLTKHIYRDESFTHEKHPVESVRGEASLLDSADEDSGIESCILERKNEVAE